MYNYKLIDDKYSVDWFTHNIPTWDQVFKQKEIKGKNSLKFLEIGCFEGRATNYLLENILTGDNCEIHVVDTFQGSLNESGMNWDSSYEFSDLYKKFSNNISQYKDKVSIHVGESGKILKKDFEDNSFDFIYVDGSHTTPDVLQDAILSHSLLKVGGIIIFDDLGWKDPNNPHPTSSPEMGITFFYNAYILKYDILFQGYQLGLIKKAH